MSEALDEIVSRMRALGVSDDDHNSELVQLAHELAARMQLGVVWRIGAGTRVYRATKHHDQMPRRVEELWHPPAEKAPRNRANARGRPMFYSCSGADGAFREAGVGPGMRAIHATWTAKRDMVLARVGYSAAVLRRAGASRPLPYEDSLDAQMLPSQREARDFVAWEFTDPNDKRYRIPSAIADMLLATEPENVVDGLMYPSVMKGAVDNVALRPGFVETGGLELTEATLVLVDQLDKDGVGGVKIATLADVSNGALRWKYTGETTTLQPGEGVAMRLSPGDKQPVIDEGRIKFDGRAYNVMPGYYIEMLHNGEVVVRDLRAGLFLPVA